jgi:3-oxoacyl-[acyl-carrier protein] reductase
MDLALRDRSALVTGASAGIGTGIAQCLAREGVRLALAGRNRAALETLAAEARTLGAPEAHVVVGDVAGEAGAAQVAADALSALGGRIDILVNNAGGSRPLGSAEETDAFWDEAFDLNFASARRITRPLLGPMKAARFGRIVNITGAIYGKTVNGAGPAKAALLAWSRQLSFELASHGITVNCVAPGRINSVQILERLHPTPASREAYIRDNIPAGRFGEPVELGALVAFLASPLAAYISGAHIPVDGAAVRIAV